MAKQGFLEPIGAVWVLRRDLAYQMHWKPLGLQQFLIMRLCS